MPLLSAVTTCKGRLEHLKRSLPALMALPDCEVVVVDYDCPDGAGAWVGEAFPAARLVSVTDRPFFNASEARNLGVAAATGAWLLMIDADVIVAAHFLEGVRASLQDGCFVIPPDPIQEAGGTTLIARADMAAIGGYDPVFEGYGSEDRDIRTRLEAAGRRMVVMPQGLIQFIRHDDAARGRFHPITDPNLNMIINRVYWRAKTHLAALGITLDEPARRALYERIRQAATAADGLKSIEIVFGEDDIRGMRLPMSLRYRLQ